MMLNHLNLMPVAFAWPVDGDCGCVYATVTLNYFIL